MAWFVDVPNPASPESPWVNIDVFDSKEDALRYVQTTFGADENGMIGLISYDEDYDEED